MLGVAVAVRSELVKLSRSFRSEMDSKVAELKAEITGFDTRAELAKAAANVRKDVTKKVRQMKKEFATSVSAVKKNIVEEMDECGEAQCDASDSYHHVGET